MRDVANKQASLSLRRLRRTEGLRRLVRETRLSAQDLIAPLFAIPGRSVSRPIQSMPGVTSLSPDLLAAEGKALAKLGIPAVLLFGVPRQKDDAGAEASSADGVVQEAVSRIKAAAPDLVVITDVCLCAYTTHGHCGLVKKGARHHSKKVPGTFLEVLNDETLDRLAEVAVSHAEAGVDLVAPSAMMDGQVGAIRRALDEAGWTETGILSYSAKYASGFYGPFREAQGSAPAFGDRRGYQMDPANVEEALREVRQDLDEGADLVMVKPALAFLDVIWRVKQAFGVPVVAYNVSGEYSMVKAAAQAGYLDEPRVILEILTSIKRAGADRIITYFAKEAATSLL